MLAGGLVLLLAATPGCRTPRTEVPPEPAFSNHGGPADRPPVGFSSEPPAAQPNPMPNGMPGDAQVPGAYGTAQPTFSPNGPQGQAGLPDANYAPQSVDQQFEQPRGQMGEPGQAPQPQ